MTPEETKAFEDKIQAFVGREVSARRAEGAGLPAE